MPPFSQNHPFHLPNNTQSPVQCDVCHMIFVSKSLLNKHRSVHIQEKELILSPESDVEPEVHQQFRSEPVVIDLTSSDVEVKKEPISKPISEPIWEPISEPTAKSIWRQYACCSCDVVCDSSKSLKSHYTTVHNDIYKCKLCEKILTTSEGLEKHTLYIHSNIIPIYKCLFCEERFQTRTQRKRHESKYHRGRFLYKCDFCEIHAFPSNGELRNHLKKYHTDSPCYECSKCSKRLWTKYSLELHKTVHSKRFPCKFCKEKFATRREHLNHCRRTHNRKYSCQNNKCAHCPAYFLKAIDLKRHVKYSHKGSLAKK